MNEDQTSEQYSRKSWQRITIYLEHSLLMLHLKRFVSDFIVTAETSY